MLFSRLAPDKTVFAIDDFGASEDPTPCITTDTRMSDIYREKLNGMTQRTVYESVTASCTNVKTLTADSAVVTINSSHLCFAYIDGCHTTTYVKNDFRLVWPKMVSGSTVAFDDYGFDLPTVTGTIDEIISFNRRDIADCWCEGPKTLFIRRR